MVTKCRACGYKPDDAKYTFSGCEKWEPELRFLTEKNRTFHSLQQCGTDDEKGELEFRCYWRRNSVTSIEMKQLGGRNSEHVIRRPKNDVIPEKGEERKIWGGMKLSSELLDIVIQKGSEGGEETYLCLQEKNMRGYWHTVFELDRISLLFFHFPEKQNDTPH